MVEKSADILMPGPNEPAILGREGSVPATTDTERELAGILADVVHVDHVAAESHFFDDLGANSLVMAQFCARVRKRPDLPSVSMKDIYRNPTVRGLAAALVQAAPPSVGAPAPAAPDAPLASPARTTPASTARYVLCGIAQLLIFLGYSFVVGMATVRAYEWVAAGSGIVGIYLRSLVFGGGGFIVLCLFPIAAKWILVGRWKPGEFPLWSAAYLRFWLIKALLHANPMILFVGNPLYVMYLRALGARIGKDVTILSHSVPVCTDLLTIGAGTVIRKDSFFLCYRAHAGRIQTGRITLGRDVFLGEKTVLDIDTAMGDGAQLGHASALYRGQHVPDGERRHGSPAQPTTVDYVRVGPARCGTLRRACFALTTLLQLLFLYLPLTVGGFYMLFAQVPALRRRLEAGTALSTVTEFVTDTLLLSSVLFFGAVLLGLVVLFTLPRLLSLAVRPDRVYPLYGLHYALHRAVAGMTNIKFFTWLFGDSSYIVPYLRCLGYDLSRVEQTGSNFGTEVQHETPFLVSVGSGTMVADGLSVINADFSRTSFRVSRASIGPHNFLGNNIAYPAGARTGDNCLLATKVMVPLDGELRQGVGLLGSPCFEIPRSVERDTRFDHLRTGDALRRSLAAKNRYNLRSMALFLLLRWVHAALLTALALASVDLYGALGPVVIAGYLALTLGFTAAYWILVERAIASFRALRPRLCSIYDPYFWWHERLWKVPDEWLEVFNGTPFKSLVWRLMGVRVGRRVFDDGCYITERTLATIGDDCTLNAGSKIQCHSQEDGTFKSDRTTLGADCTLGIGAHVHYGVTMGDEAVLASDSFLMKGEEVPARAEWGGNPAAPTAS
ncbi:peptide synthetase [Streptomyces sp. NTH33]|uniref:Pls/PosA family non-ribosomal peptide synthetase n=1 Tax=Streptomyces sp. NTH33 TaxID=1735453 RepID=UPI000DAA5094|nr:Pls/PosA family non-ribosomal peptide synthetase [Streptomyces sp. NTH33]PZH19755.1 peptide synthetase [Streptomyces sp. NTH33]